jgi:hypothetical protein
MKTLRPSISRLALTAGATAILAACAGALTPAISPNAAGTAVIARSPAGYTFQTINNMKDPTFNQLLGINTKGVISGYFGSGAKGHPNKGYIVVSPYKQTNFRNENYPGSVQTQVTAINNADDTAGFWVDAKQVNRGFIRWHNVFTTYTAPKIGKGTVTQILGINDGGEAVGFYVNGSGVSFGFTLEQATGKFGPVTPPGASNVTASGINSHGDITGFYLHGKESIGFLKKGNSYSAFHFPKSKMTMPFGINDKLDIVGQYVDSAGATHGFLLTSPLAHAKWTSIDDPNGVGTTTINGLNDALDMVGFYVDSDGNTDGMLITP